MAEVTTKYASRNGSCLAMFLLGGMLCLWSACSVKEREPAWFRALDSKATGLHFTNQLKPTASFNLFSYMYYYNGAGVGSGDFNNDGLIDLFFTANQGANALYLNKSALQFEDVSEQAGLRANGAWSTGVSVVDINNDGLLDIYVCRVARYNALQGSNQLWVCTGIDAKGIPHYEDQAASYGLDFAGYSTQAVFLDYDGDGDLDLFLLNHPVSHDGNYAPRANFANTTDSLAGQKLFRNDQPKNGANKSNIHFTDVTQLSGILGTRIGYGLGVAVADLDLDGWPDIYVGNDFHENDYLYMNQRNGRFREENTSRLSHTSQFSMGVDLADVNNDAYPDIISLDMQPYDPYMIRRSPSDDDYTIFQQKLLYGYAPQYARNNLQYNRGNGKFSEVGQYAGVHATDWSWASLWMDFNNDGKKDLFVSNGIPKRMNDIDYIQFVSGNEIQQKLKDNRISEKELALTEKFPEIRIPNQFYLNRGNFSFTNLTDSITANPPAFSNGAIYADLDNDGDLDIVVNNINEPVTLYENKTNTAERKRAYASVALQGAPGNVQAIGAKLLVYAKEELRMYEQQTVHGFQSSMLAPLHVGLDAVQPDSVLLVWPDNSYQRITLTPGQRQQVSYRTGLPRFDYARFHQEAAVDKTLAWENITSATGLSYTHRENQFNEFDREPLMPHMVSAEGPALAVADINHDGLEDVFIGASKTYRNAVFLQTPGGKFLQKTEPALAQDTMWESVDAKWMDVNGDTHPDLLLASGGNEYYGADKHLRPLLYINDGNGNLSKKEDAFGEVYCTQSRVAAGDFTGDGIVDLFVAGRAEPWQYGKSPRSYLLQNDGTGRFTDVTERYARQLMYPGMVTSATWTDLDTDGKQDLLLTMEWGEVALFLNKGKQLEQRTLTGKKGWWQFAYVQDVDQDGDMDIIIGNLGLNTRLQASEKEPVSLYINDFDDNGRTEQVLTYFLKGKEIPLPGKNQLEKSLPYLKKKFLYAADFAKASLDDMFGKSKLDRSAKLTANCFANSILLNEGDLRFTLQPLPFEAQLSTLRTAVAVKDANGKTAGTLLAGNFYPNAMEIGRQDADWGTWLQYTGNGHFRSSLLNGITIAGEVRNSCSIRIGKRNAIILARNNAPVMVIAVK